MESIQQNQNLDNIIRNTAICFCNLENIKDYFGGDYIQALYDDCNGTDQMALTCATKELVNGYNNPDSFDVVLELFISKFVSIFNNLNSEQNNSNLYYNIISNIIGQLHKELNFESNQNNIFQNQPFSNETKKDLMLGLYMENFESNNISEISKLIFSTMLLMKECSICHSITYNFQIQNIFQFDVDEILSSKKSNNNNANNGNNNGENNIKVSLDDCFNYYLDKKNFNNLQCKREGCNSLNGNEKKFFYWTSDILIISLQRKSYEKEEKDFQVRKTIDISQFLDKDSLNHLTKFNNKEMLYTYDLNSMLYKYNDDYISCCRVQNSLDKWYYIYHGTQSEECTYIMSELNKFKHFQPVLLFYEYQMIPNPDVIEEDNDKRISLDNEIFLNLLMEQLIINKENKAKNQIDNPNMGNKNEIKVEEKKEELNIMRLNKNPGMNMNNNDIKVEGKKEKIKMINENKNDDDEDNSFNIFRNNQNNEDEDDDFNLFNKEDNKVNNYNVLINKQNNNENENKKILNNNLNNNNNQNNMINNRSNNSNNILEKNNLKINMMNMNNNMPFNNMMNNNLGQINNEQNNMVNSNNNMNQINMNINMNKNNMNNNNMGQINMAQNIMVNSNNNMNQINMNNNMNQNNMNNNMGQINIPQNNMVNSNNNMNQNNMNNNNIGQNNNAQNNMVNSNNNMGQINMMNSNMNFNNANNMNNIQGNINLMNNNMIMNQNMKNMNMMGNSLNSNMNMNIMENHMNNNANMFGNPMNINNNMNMAGNQMAMMGNPMNMMGMNMMGNPMNMMGMNMMGNPMTMMGNPMNMMGMNMMGNPMNMMGNNMNMIGNPNVGQNNVMNVLQMNNFMNLNKMNNSNNLNNMMNVSNNNNEPNLQRQNSANKKFYQIEFMFINKNGKNVAKIVVPATSDDTIKQMIQKFKNKIYSDDTRKDIKIEKYLLNKIFVLNPDSEENITSQGIDDNSKIEAIEGI